MIHRTTNVILLTCFLFGCSPQINSDKEVARQKRTDGYPSNKNLLDKLKIPKSWTEITLVNNVWTYFIPCHNERELQAIDLTKVDNKEAVIWNTGTERQWHALKKIIMQKDSLIFETVLPYDTTAVVFFTFKYLNKESNIVHWGVNGTYCYYIPTQDTSKYTKIQQPCNEDEK